MVFGVRRNKLRPDGIIRIGEEFPGLTIPDSPAGGKPTRGSCGFNAPKRKMPEWADDYFFPLPLEIGMVLVCQDDSLF